MDSVSSKIVPLLSKSKSMNNSTSMNWMRIKILIMRIKMRKFKVPPREKRIENSSKNFGNIKI